MSAPLLGVCPAGEGGIVHVDVTTEMVHSSAAVISEPMIFVVIIVSLIESKRFLFIELAVAVWMARARTFVVGVFNMATTTLVLIVTLVLVV